MSTHSRRASGRVDHYDGYADDDAVSLIDEDAEDDFHNTPDMQRFIRSMSKTVETSSIGLSFDFENLSFATKQGKKILTDITGTMPRGSCWGVMGGSGAGKSTFLNVLMGKAHATGGSISMMFFLKAPAFRSYTLNLARNQWTSQRHEQVQEAHWIRASGRYRFPRTYRQGKHPPLCANTAAFVMERQGHPGPC